MSPYEQTRDERKITPSGWLFALAILAVCAVVVGGVGFYRNQEVSLKERAQVELAAIADLKTEQIVSWRTQHLKTAQRLTGSRLYAEVVANWGLDAQDGSAQGILQRMRAEQPSGDYFDVLLLGVDGTELLRLGDDAGSLVHEGLLVALEQAFVTGEPVLTDLHLGPGDLPTHMDVVAPLYYERDGALVSPGAVILQASASDFLYPLVQSWPTPSDTAETVLVVRDGDDVLFLNDLRHMDGAALDLRIPLTETDDPAVMAVTGYTGVVEGVDYRGEQVYAYVAAVPGSDWHIVTKIDVVEALAPWRDQARLIVLLVLGLVSIIGVAFALVWQSSRAARLGSLLDAESIQRQAEQKLLSLFKAAPLGLGITVERTFTEVSEYFCQMIGYSSAELLGKKSRMIYSDEEEYVRLGTLFYGPGPVGVRVAETRFVAKDGSVIEVFVSAAAIDPADQTRGTSFAVLDITDRKRVEEEIRMHGALLESLVTIAQTPWESADGLFRLVLDEAMRLTRSTVGRLCPYDERGDSIALPDTVDVFADGDPRQDSMERALLDHVCGQVVRERAPVLVAPDVSAPAVYAGMREGFENALAIPVFSDDRIVAIAAVAGAPTTYAETDQRRITVLADAAWKVVRRHEAEAEVRRINASLEHLVRERTEDLQKLNEELQQTNRELVDANEAKTRFLRSMSHELRTPLNSIIGFSGIMLDGLAGAMTDEQCHQLEMINRSGRHLLNLINDILDLSRIEAGKVDMQIESFDARLLAQEVHEAVSPVAHDKGLDTALHLPENGQCAAMVSDPVKVRQVLLNLIGNAVKFTDSGTVVLRVECDTPGRVRFAITDTGPGIPAEEHETIFGEFTQRQRSFAVQHEGTGLGLAISRGLAALLGGTISLESTVGEGSTFTLELPARHTF